MKRTWLLPAACMCLIIASCKSDHEDTPKPEPANAEKTLMSIEKIWEPSSGMVTFSSVVLKGNVSQNTLTFWADSTKDSYTRYFYDQGGLLQKILYNKVDANFSKKDSLVIDRKGNGVIDLIASNAATIRCTVLLLPDGGKEISYAKNAATVKKIVLDKDGYPVTDIETNSSANNSITLRYFYDANKKLTSRLDTTRSGTTIFTTKLIVTAENSPNTHMVSLLKKLFGADLEWMMHDQAFGTTPFDMLNTYFTTSSTLLNGGIRSWTASPTISTDGVNFGPAAGSERVYETTYDTKGRLSKRIMRYSPYTQIFNYKYFD
ncbi:hypothetical protein LZZ85_20300 [Terrimonas sp. NA20]|uniref:DUF4595 domain-containing protein n=1 Tax=Terrimonas ginsenosidimutans TaxID=2908004 RepID=A0ABS9KWM7_9BACT|nr:hypothetical protein [Terrimonas ginsenosidimutans]MCG2616652.1 hypothetical protein [Terrimonas ginsenosidimutans]